MFVVLRDSFARNDGGPVRGPVRRFASASSRRAQQEHHRVDDGRLGAGTIHQLLDGRGVSSFRTTSCPSPCRPRRSRGAPPPSRPRPKRVEGDEQADQRLLALDHGLELVDDIDADGRARGSVFPAAAERVERIRSALVPCWMQPNCWINVMTTDSRRPKQMHRSTSPSINDTSTTRVASRQTCTEDQ